MWNFSIFCSLITLARTWPFVLLRLVVYLAIPIAYCTIIACGAGVGYGIGHIFILSDADAPARCAGIGGLIGFITATALVYGLREYLLYILKAGHIAVLVHLIAGEAVPGGQGQLTYARKMVTERFLEANVFFVFDQLIKAVLGSISTLTTGLASLIPVPGLMAAANLINSFIRMSITYVDEIILGYNIRMTGASPFENGMRGVVLYAQNSKIMVKNAIWLSFIVWTMTAVIFAATLTPAAAMVYWIPGPGAGYAVLFALALAWALKLALLEPFAITALMTVYFSAIEGQVADPEREQRLSQTSQAFRNLKDKALGGLAAV
ncbi:hypothetical protein [Phyllobacterium myrsinacearum]|uniref:Uncharacterized protein n=1 Tax=Phyllobacterium myrsinacearum TaxID=28101 RepID=A0A839EQJ7_9HYPH|nr:hypothetical protein [Phyllobacterium myrsinacearum]MBA8880425.1 hypothetical protein [Phyllobacterium myrsinacearum]